MRTTGILHGIMAMTCLFALERCAQAGTAYLGSMKADSILFLGNSITFCPQPDSTEWWGLSASDPDHDYAHLLVNHINAAAGSSLAITPPSPHQGDANNRWYPSYGLPSYNGNILNMADILERSFNTWDNARIQNQLDLKPDIVVLQFGENLANGTDEQFRTALDTLLTGLKNSSNPNIFVASYILEGNTAIDNIKRELCAEDPTHRVFVELNDVQNDPVNMGNYAHPSDAGMAVIADRMFSAMTAHAVPEPSSVILSSIAFVSFVAYCWKRRQAIVS